MTIFSTFRATAWVVTVNCFLIAQNGPPKANSATRNSSVNQNSLIIQDFGKRVDDYVKLRKKVQSGLSIPKSGSSVATVKEYQQSLAQNIRAERSQAKTGDLFTPPASQLFRKLIATPLQGDQGSKIQASLRHAEPVHGLTLEVNQEYPQNWALQSTPPSLLLDLPKLPAELEYRIVGRELILLDTAANLVVDLLPDALPKSQSER
jgi:hypothetical protein